MEQCRALERGHGSCASALGHHAPLGSRQFESPCSYLAGVLGYQIIPPADDAHFPIKPVMRRWSD